jgi:hypothetical protein
MISRDPEAALRRNICSLRPVNPFLLLSSGLAAAEENKPWIGRGIYKHFAPNGALRQLLPDVQASRLPFPSPLG